MRYVGIIIGFILVSLTLKAQTGQSPYSSLGIGELYTGATATNSGMGHVGVGTFSNLHINYLNPALLPHTSLTSFEFSVWGEWKQLKKETSVQRQATGNLNQVLLSIPILANRYTCAVGLQPVSSVNYSSVYTSVLTSNEPVRYTAMGKGGVNALFIAQGITIVSGLSLGIQASYIFGSIQKSTLVETPSTISSNPVEIIRESHYRGFTVKPGISFESTMKKNRGWVIGITSELGNPINVTRSVFNQHKTIIGNIITSDTSSHATLTRVSYPWKLAGGISVYKSNKWVIGSDFSMQDWASFNDGSLGKSYSIGIGGELIPDVGSMRYLNRSTYRIGLYITKTPFIINNQSVYDYQLTLGSSLPVARLSYINVALQLGQRGVSNEWLIRERYVRLTVGVSFNDRWFIRRKYD